MSFNMIKSPDDYARAAIIAQLVEEEMLSRLDWMVLNPLSILDVGCGLGAATHMLSKRYPKAKIIGVDASSTMLNACVKNNEQIDFVCADAVNLPLANQSVDMVFANLVLPWCDNMQAVLVECQRVLRPNGLIMLSSLGLDTAKSQPILSQAQGFPNLIDMHDLGDALVKAGLIEPVIDVDYRMVAYRQIETLMDECQASGMGDLAHVDVRQFSQNAAGQWEVFYEIIFAHAFAKQMTASTQETEGVSYFPLSSLRAQLGAVKAKA